MSGSDRPPTRYANEHGHDASFAQYQSTRDLRARNHLIEAHLNLARQEAFRLMSRGEPVEDLVQVAQVGLLKAVERYDPARGVPFTAFARPTIAGELRRHFRDSTWVVRVPRGLKDLHGRLGRATSDLTHGLGRRPSAAELAGELGCTLDELFAVLELGSARHPISLSTPATDEEAPMDLPGDDEFGALAGAADRVTIRQLLAELPQRERGIVYMRFFAQLGQSEIADRVGLSQAHVSRLLRSALAHLRGRLLDLET